MRAVVLNFTGARENWGCQATSIGLYRFLLHVLKPHGFTAIDTVPFPSSHLKDIWHQKKYGAQIRNIFSNAAPASEELMLLERLCYSRFRHHVDTLKNADLIFFQGEGTMGTSKFYENIRVFALAYLAKKLWNKPVISLNQSFVIQNKADIPAATNIFDSFNLNVFREKKSWKIATDSGLKSSILCPDFAFVDAAKRPVKESMGSSEKYFCVTGSAALNEYDIDGYARTIEAVCEQTGLRPVCMYSRKSDRKFAQKIIGKLGKSRVKSISPSDYRYHSQILPILAQAAFTLGGRYHTAISSLSMRTPVILTAGNSHKNEGLGDMLGLKLPVLHPGDATAIVKQAKSYLKSEGQVADVLEAGLQSILTAHVTFSENLSRVISEILEGRSSFAAPELIGGMKARAKNTPLRLPEITPQTPMRGRYRSIRTQFDLTANLRRYEWDAKVRK